MFTSLNELRELCELTNMKLKKSKYLHTTNHLRLKAEQRSTAFILHTQRMEN